MSETAEASVLITHEEGLHARPSVKLTKLAKTFPAEIQMALKADGPWLDAKSIVKVMASKAPKDTVLHLRAQGEQASEAVQALVDLINRDFDESGPHALLA